MYPHAQIDMLVGPVSGELLEDCPYINNLIYFDTTRKHRYENRNSKRNNFFSYVKELKKARYDKAYVLKRSLSSAALVFLAGIPQRIGFNTEHRGFLLTKPVPYEKDRHEVECFLDVLRADGFIIRDKHLESWVKPEHSATIEEIFKEYGVGDEVKVQIHATSGNTNKQWSPEYFAKLVEYLVNERKVRVFYAGAATDAKVYEQIHSLIHGKLEIKPVNLCGKLTLQESLALTSKMDLLVGCDSGNLHMAASVNVPVIGIYGPMDYKKWGAWGDIHTCIVENLPCVPCELKRKCEFDRACLKNIKPERVIGIVDKKLNEILLKSEKAHD